MAQKIVVEERSWNETPQLIKENLSSVYPGIEEYYNIGDGYLAYIPGVATKFSQVMLFPAVFKETGESDLIGYYPIRDNYIQHFGVMEAYPITQPGETFKTKRGFVTIVELDGSLAYQFTKVINRMVTEEEDK